MSVRTVETCEGHASQEWSIPPFRAVRVACRDAGLNRLTAVKWVASNHWTLTFPSGAIHHFTLAEEATR